MFTISKGVVSAYPSVFAFALHADGIRLNLLPDSRPALEAAADRVRAVVGGANQVSDLPALRVWRDAYAAASVKPSAYRSSVEALVRRALKGPLPTVSPLVDLYNSVSLSRLVPLGACDATALSGPVELRHCDPAADAFVPLGGQTSNFPLRATVPVYASGTKVLCWCFNCRDAAPTALTDKTTDAVFFTEGVAEWQVAGARAALDEVAERLFAAGASVAIERFRNS